MKEGMNKTKKKKSTESNKKEYPPAYFKSLTVENIRCFGPKQTLDLSAGKGKPARWTVILGDNGIGKTTLLQCLTLLEPKKDPKKGIYYANFQIGMLGEGYFKSLLRAESRNCSIKSTVGVGGMLSVSNDIKVFEGCDLDVTTAELKEEWGSTYIYGTTGIERDLNSLRIYGYGASRILGKSLFILF